MRSIDIGINLQIAQSREQNTISAINASREPSCTNLCSSCFVGKLTTALSFGGG